MTYSSFVNRWEQHKKNIIAKSDEIPVYNLIEDVNEVEFEVLIDCDDLGRDVSEDDVKMMELAMIKLYKPVGNVVGVSRQY